MRLLLLGSTLAAVLGYFATPPALDGPRILPIPEETTTIDNGMYDRPEWAKSWWDPPAGFKFSLSALQLLNPVRIPFFDRAWKRFPPKVPRDAAYLDLGCGGGIVTEALERKGYHMTGIDISKASVETAREHARRSGLSIWFDVGSAYSLPYANSSFDGIVMSDVLEHLHDLPRAVFQVCRTLKPGGVLVFDTITRTYLSHLANLFMTVWARGVHTHDWRLFVTPDELRTLFRATGCFDEPVLEPKELRGMRPLPNLFGDSPGLLKFVETESIEVGYLGWVRKRATCADCASSPAELVVRLKKEASV
ncbi:S-adenosyl-L-methionine-dependent methyltransferase [Hyaloraphidium curvatum]|nr:S-adenosyl-L-methionine-dependent methyltransferase [Hyaloraphidium curvatum]